MTARVQMSRRKPWRCDHPTAVRVDRATRWGNPYPVSTGSGTLFPREDAVQLFRDNLVNGEAWFCETHGAWCPGRPLCPAGNRFTQLDLTVDDLAPLRGKDVACWCTPDQACHGDIIRAIANAYAIQIDRHGHAAGWVEHHPDGWYAFQGITPLGLHPTFVEARQAVFSA